ncbi:MAG TPA: prepilin-type N-terminal cleavage/methylation domain-containing protein [Accumulibacter sp.]|nr:prepilin-type N-terminal cleavage/methylation domain-containing protein [Accumulibacter sp.]
MNQRDRQQSGFTLVEIAIVLVIIGLLLGGVLKGQEMINSAKVKNMVNDFRTVSSLVYAYQDRFKALPGDQTQAQLTQALGAPAANAACAPVGANSSCNPNNGRIDGYWNDGAATGTGTLTSEASVFWSHVRLANLATGTTVINDVNYRPRNADGGFLGVESGISPAGAATPMIAGMRGSFFVCSTGILGRYVRQIDIAMDDGNTSAGSVQAIPTTAARGTAPTATANINDGTTYTVCAAY